MNNIIKISSALLAMTLTGPIVINATAQTQTKEVTEVTKTRGDGSSTTTTTTTYRIADTDREKIRTYVKKTGKGKLPKGFVRTSTYTTEFPSTWRERVVIGEPMPEVYYSQSAPLPSDIVDLGAPEKTTMIALDGSIIRVETGTRRVLDVYPLEEY